MAILSFQNIYFDDVVSNFQPGDAFTPGDDSFSFQLFNYGSLYEDFDSVYNVVLDTGDDGSGQLVHEDFTEIELTFSGTVTSSIGTTVLTVEGAPLASYYVGAAEDGGIVIGTLGSQTLQVTGVMENTDIDETILTFNAEVDFDGYFLLTDVTYPKDEISTVGVNYDDPFVVCFAEGTLIATPNGEVAVETLTSGQLVLTADGISTPVKWLGRQTILKLFSPAERVAPVVIEAGAFAPNVPHSDLTVTSDHAMVLDGALVHAGALVNGDTVRRVPLAALPARRTVYHIETEGHSIILANGAESETFIDNVSRRCFDNYADYVALCGADEGIAPMVLPRAKGPRQVPVAIRTRLAKRAAELRASERLCG